MRPSLAPLLFGLAVLFAWQVSAQAEPVSIIFDTDMNGDVDDVGALAILNRLTNLGEAKMLACVSDAEDKPDHATGATIHAINSYYGHADVPIGTYKGTKYGSTSTYDGKIREEMAKDFPTDDKLPSPLEIYRKTLAAAPDHSVTVVSVGMLGNLRELLQSPADAASPLPGLELVRQKVKQLVSMAGAYPSSGGTGECNMCGGMGDGKDGQYVAENWPTPILYSGFEIGAPITTGQKLKDNPASDPVRRSYELYTQFNGRNSWDPTAVLAAVRDPKRYWDIKADGYNKVADNGANLWSPTPNHGHSYLVQRVPPEQMADVLNDLMDAPPTATK